MIAPQNDLDLSQLVGLNEDHRLAARETARQNVIKRIGPKPDRARFRDYTISAWPRGVIWAVAAALAVVFVAAAAISTFRLYAAGRDYFMLSLPIEWQAKAVGVATAAMAEFLVITAASAATILFTGRSRWLAAVPIGIGLAVAFVGNHEITQAASLWGWLDTLAPPLAVLSVGVMGERVLLLYLRERWDNERAYQTALAEWTAATADPERTDHWRAVYAHALKAELIRANGAGRGQAQRREIMAQMSGWHWRHLVEAELNADEWATVDLPNAAPVFQALPIVESDRHPLSAAPDLVAASTNGRRNGHN